MISHSTPFSKIGTPCASTILSSPSASLPPLASKSASIPRALPRRWPCKIVFFPSTVASSGIASRPPTIVGDHRRRVLRTSVISFVFISSGERGLCPNGAYSFQNANLCRIRGYFSTRVVLAATGATFGRAMLQTPAAIAAIRKQTPNRTIRAVRLLVLGSMCLNL